MDKPLIAMRPVMVYTIRMTLSTYRTRYPFSPKKKPVKKGALPLQIDPVDPRKTSLQILEDEVRQIVRETEKQTLREQMDRELRHFILWE